MQHSKELDKYVPLPSSHHRYKSRCNSSSRRSSRMSGHLGVLEESPLSHPRRKWHLTPGRVKVLPGTCLPQTYRPAPPSAYLTPALPIHWYSCGSDPCLYSYRGTTKQESDTRPWECQMGWVWGGWVVQGWFWIEATGETVMLLLRACPFSNPIVLSPPPLYFFSAATSLALQGEDSCPRPISDLWGTVRVSPKHRPWPAKPWVVLPPFSGSCPLVFSVQHWSSLSFSLPPPPLSLVPEAFTHPIPSSAWRLSPRKLHPQLTPVHPSDLSSSTSLSEQSSLPPGSMCSLAHVPFYTMWLFD